MKKAKKEKQLARATNKKGFRDLVMSTEGILLNIVENSTSDKLMRGDLRKAWGRLERHWNPKTREDKVQFYTKFLHYKLENVNQRPMDWLAFMEKKRNELANTGHIMDDEMFITFDLKKTFEIEPSLKMGSAHLLPDNFNPYRAFRNIRMYPSSS